ncbi:MAG TPA: lytic transglycosylase domain-containing protein [Thermoanaerobaculia bacterium]|nr:lytic transglycosylase domain-containing protein [Thermoanaerobaculia bacterium]
MWRRSVRVLKRVRSFAQGRVLAAALALPIAFGVVGLPTEAMDIDLRRFTSERAASRTEEVKQPEMRTLGVFTTPAVREGFMSPEWRPRTLEIVREEFFKTHIPYGSIIYREATRHRLPPELLAAVVGAESDFRVTLVSHRDARGLMQILPETGRLLGARDLFDPEENIRAGAKYLRYLHDRFGESRVALAAYNAGEGNVRKWGGIPPFEETETFLRRVNARANIYRRRVRSNYLTTLGIAVTE